MLHGGCLRRRGRNIERIRRRRVRKGVLRRDGRYLRNTSGGRGFSLVEEGESDTVENVVTRVEIRDVTSVPVQAVLDVGIEEVTETSLLHNKSHVDGHLGGPKKLERTGQRSDLGLERFCLGQFVADSVGFGLIDLDPGRHLFDLLFDRPVFFSSEVHHFVGLGLRVSRGISVSWQLTSRFPVPSLPTTSF